MRFASHRVEPHQARPSADAECRSSRSTLALLAWPGCTPRAPDRLVVATSWPAAERTRLEAEFQSWVAASARSSRPIAASGSSGWCLRPETILCKLARRAAPPQVFLGGASDVCASRERG